MNRQLKDNPRPLEKAMEEPIIINSEEFEYDTEEEMYQQIGLIKLKDMEMIPINKVKRQVDKLMGKKVLDINEIEEEITLEILEETNEANRSNYKKYEERSCNYQRPCVKPKEFLDKTAKFGVRIIPNHRPNKKKLTLELISETMYKLNLDGIRNREEVLDFSEKSMMSILNLNTDWRASKFLNYIEHSLY